MTMTEPAVTTTVPRPQPLGLFDGPAGLVPVAAGGGAAELLAALARGATPATWPACGAALGATVAGDVDGALAVLGDDDVSTIGRLVLAPSSPQLAAARNAAGADPGLRVLVAAAAYASGLSDEPPSPDGVDGEFAVLALTVRAARALEFKDPTRALQLLREAVPHAAGVGPVLQARVLGMLAEHTHHAHGPAQGVLDLYDEALALLQGTDLVDLRAGFHLERGLVAHQLADGGRHHLVAAIRSYQSALVSLDEQRDPERFALANMNCAIAILALPMTQASDQVRLGVAVQSLRAALRVYRPETHAYEWSSSQLNLANALQYLPSTHREQNLDEAVALYDEVLAFRSPRSDRMGYARALANQANALAHLGRFDPAEQRYREAGDLFAQVGDHDAVEVVERQLAQVAEAREAAR